jgi:hypothetical protein
LQPDLTAAAEPNRVAVVINSSRGLSKYDPLVAPDTKLILQFCRDVMEKQNRAWGNAHRADRVRIRRFEKPP